LLSEELFVRIDGTGRDTVLQGPGWGPSVEYLRRTLLPLLPELRVLSYDVRNTGRAPRRPAPSSQATDRLVDDLETIVREQRFGPFVLMGHSHGAFVAMAYALRHPDDLDAMVLLTPSLHERGATPGAEEILSRWEADPEREQAVRWTRSRPQHPRELREDRELALWLRRGMAASFYDLDAMARFQAKLIHGPMPSIDALHGLPERREPWVARGLRQIGVPTLVIGASHDIATPVGEAEEVARRIPGATLRVIERAGHNPWAERPDEFAATIRQFLDKLPPTRDQRRALL
jgi:proline iminopeptidase